MQLLASYSLFCFSCVLSHSENKAIRIQHNTGINNSELHLTENSQFAD